MSPCIAFLLDFDEILHYHLCLTFTQIHTFMHSVYLHADILTETKILILPYKAESARSRTVITTQQVQILKDEFSQNRFPTPERKWELTELTGLEYKVITNWFQNKRKLEYRLNKLQSQHSGLAMYKEEAQQL